MFLTEEQARARLNSEENLANRFNPEVKEIPVYRPGKDRENLSEETRTEIAIRSRLGEDSKILSLEFGTTQGNISHIKTARTKGIDEDAVEKSISSVRDKALDRLMASLGLLTDDKLSGCSAKDLSVIASNMGRVVEKTIPKEADNRTQVIIYAPEIRNESRFRTIEV